MYIHKKVLLALSMFSLCIVCIAIKPSCAHAETSNSPFMYTIKKGDSLYFLSKRFNTSINKMLSQNQDISAENLPIGKSIIVQPSGYISIYTVKSGDTLWRISQKYNSNIMTISLKNYIKNPDIILVNDVLAIPRTDVKPIISATANKVISAIKNQNMQELANFVHPELGVRFSPYSYINVNKDLVFNNQSIKSFGYSKIKYTWGAYDGSGEPILLTPMEYLKKFVYDKNFANASQVSYNKLLGFGNTIENQFQVYSDSIIVEYYLPGDPRYGGMDWRSLRLVFKNYGNDWYLIGVIHNEWTI